MSDEDEKFTEHVARIDRLFDELTTVIQEVLVARQLSEEAFLRAKRKSSAKVAELIVALGEVAVFLGRHDDAVACAKAAIEIGKQTDEGREEAVRLISSVISNIGVVVDKREQERGAN